MPALTPAVREALTDSIKEWGVICPVVKDQTGYVLDGRNRIEIADELGVSYDVLVRHCTPEQRDILSIELNGARRQITAQQWKPLVDSLRAKVDAAGVHKYSDREIARAVGVDKDAVHRYKSPVSAHVATATSAMKKTKTKDGKVRTSNVGTTAIDRALHLIQQSTAGLTAIDLRNDAVLQGFGASTVSKLPTQLYERGLIEPTAPIKRGTTTVWRAVSHQVPPPPKPSKSATSIANKADKIIEGLKDPKVLEAVKEGVANEKGVREAKAALTAAEKELDAARLAQEKWEADAEKERLKLIEVARGQASKSIKTWDKLIAEVRGAWTIIAAYSSYLGDLPAINPAYERMLDRELDELRQQLEWFDKRRFPHGKTTPIAANYIDVN
jgi:ParB-like chromosome segregation protein Spo0J